MSVITSPEKFPLYDCHKVVRAAKVKAVAYHGADATIQTEEGTDIAVDSAWLSNHTPGVGGYVVFYEDGYVSWSPGPAFEQGYHLAKTDKPPLTHPDAKRATKLPVTIEYMQVQKGQANAYAIMMWIKGQGGDAVYVGMSGGEDVIGIKTLEGVMEAKPGDCIIRGIAGEFYPCKPDIFEKTYGVKLLNN